MAIKTLAELQENIEAHEAAATPGTSSEKVFGILVQLLQTLQANKEVPGPATDSVKSLRIENSNLKAQLGALSQMGDIVEQTRTSLRQREEASEADKTAVRLPAYAANLMAELNKLRKGIIQ